MLILYTVTTNRIFWSRHIKSSRFLFAVVILSIAHSLTCWLSGQSTLPSGPSIALSAVTQSIWEHGSLESQYAQDVYRQASALSQQAGGVVDQDVFALSSNNRLYPKHSLFSAVVAVPFFAVFGWGGFWVLQQVSLLVLLLSTYSIVGKLLGREVPWRTLLVTCMGTEVLLFSYDFSYELHGTAVLFLGLSLANRRPFWGAIVMGLSLFVRPTYVLLAAPLSISWALQRHDGYRIRFAIFGFALVCALHMLCNYAMWGDPFSVSYSRLLQFADGKPEVYACPTGLSWNELTRDLGPKLFGTNGILPANLAVLLLPWVIIRIRSHPEWRLLVFWLTVAFAFTLYVFSYPMWDSSPIGNRFLLPSVFLYAIPCALAFAHRDASALNRGGR